jgi:hypothetical protein
MTYFGLNGRAGANTGEVERDGALITIGDLTVRLDRQRLARFCFQVRRIVRVAGVHL